MEWLYCLSYLVDIDRNADDDVQQVSKRQAANEYVWPVPHALVLVYDPQKGGVPNDADHKHQAGNHCVDVFESVPDFSGPCAHGWQASTGHGDVGPHLVVHFPLNQPKSLRYRHCSLGNLIPWLCLPAHNKQVSTQQEEAKRNHHVCFL